MKKFVVVIDRLGCIRITLSLTMMMSILSGTFAQELSDKLTNELEGIYETSGLVGFSAAIVNADSILYLKGFGYENVDLQTAFSVDQRFSVASVSKTFIGISLMRLVEQGSLTLSTPVNEILPFEVVHPSFPDHEITVEHLARHTSGILNGDLENHSFYLKEGFTMEKKTVGKAAHKQFSTWQNNGKVELENLLRATLSIDGELYSKNRFAKSKPGESYNYSNLGAALAAYIVQLKIGTDYRTYIEQFALEELGFERGIWRNTISEIPSSYFQNQVAVPNYYPNLYPAGGMMLSGRELAVYLREMIRGFQGKSPILEAESFIEMMSPESRVETESGIFWELKGDNIFHNGGNYGVTSFMSFDRKTGIGKVFLTNISSYQDDELLKQMIGIWRKMDEYKASF